MSAALARHDQILADTVDAAGGEVVKTTGDGFLARFSSPLSGLTAAINSQLALCNEPWSMATPLRVRMGVHTGETENRDSDHFGPVVNRAARIMAAGHGGQVLFSGAAAALIERQLPPGTALRDLGRHRLKDLTLPEHLFQLVHPDLPSEYPPPVTLDSRPHNLPLQTTEFFGRESEISTIVAMLRSPSTKLVTVVGPGGAGKTRLALQVAGEMVESFRGGVFFVDLSTEREPVAAFEAVVRSLDLATTRDRDPLQTLKARLRDQEMLLVLDNLEQVTSVGLGISELLAYCPELKVMVTSRETLRVRAEQVFPVPPLDLPHPNRTIEEIGASEAVQLFVDRARSVRPEFDLTVANAPVVAEIVLRLDGLPLALELAAARLKLFTPADLLSRLRTRLDVLGAGGRDLPDRQRTLWGAIGWSYELLDSDERKAFELMSVFTSTRLEAVEEVATEVGAIDVLESLSSLVDKSLIRTEEDRGSQRFSMLLMIKEFAESQLDEDPIRQRLVRAAHARHYSEVARNLKERLSGPERESALTDLVAEIGNLRSAWRHWVNENDLKQLFGMIDALWVLHEARGWYQAAIEFATDTLTVLSRAEASEELAEEELTVRTSLARAVMAVRGYGPEVEAAFKQVLELSAASQRPIAQSSVLRALATYHMNLADFDQVVEHGRQLLELAEREDDRALEAEGHYVFGMGTAFGGNLEVGLSHLDRAIQMHDPAKRGSNRFRLGPDTGVVARIASGLLLWQRGEIDEGISRVNNGLAFARAIDHPYSIAYGLYHNGFLALGRQRYADTVEWAEQLDRIARENDYQLWSTLATVLKGVATAALGDSEEGLRLTEVGIELYQGLSSPPIFWPLILGLRAYVHVLSGDLARANELIDEALELDGGDPDHLVIKGDVMAQMGDLSGSDLAFGHAVEIASERRLRLTELRARTRMASRPGASPTNDELEALLALLSTFSEGRDEVHLLAAQQVLASFGITGSG